MGQYSQAFSVVVPMPLSRSGIVDVHIVIPYGEASVYIPYSSDTVNVLFGLDTPLLPERLTPEEFTKT